MINETRLRALYPKAPADHLRAFAASPALKAHGITTPNRIAYFLAQLGHESGGLTIREENLRYSAKRMTQVWPSRFPTLASAQPYAGNPKALANKVYNGRMGNRTGSDDGWTYRGRGYIQITGKDGYVQVGVRAGLDLLADPDLACRPGTAVAVAAAFWTWKGLNPVCDAGDFRRCTKIINGGYNGMADREAWLKRTRTIMQSETPPVAVAVEQSRGAVGTTVAVGTGSAVATSATVETPKPAPDTPAPSSATPWIVGAIALAVVAAAVILIARRHRRNAAGWNAQP